MIAILRMSIRKRAGSEAGDLYAAGFLYGLTRELPLPTCGEIGGLCAAEIISHVGARPETALSRLVAEAGLA